jgi:protein dithiol:quinone oxidoreductase
MPSTRTINFWIFLGCAGLLGFGYYLQYVDGLEPCPLCMFQRAFFLCVGLTGLAAALQKPRAFGTRVYAFGVMLFAIGGGIVAGRQVWLQHLPPDKVPECGPGLEYMLQQFPLSDMLKKVFMGSGECAEVNWTLLGLSIAEWALLAFVALLLLGIANFFRAGRPSRA